MKPDTIKTGATPAMAGDSARIGGKETAGLQLDGTVETSYRRGWIVGMAFALECWFYEDACRRYGR